MYQQKSAFDGWCWPFYQYPAWYEQPVLLQAVWKLYCRLLGQCPAFAIAALSRLQRWSIHPTEPYYSPACSETSWHPG